MRKVEVLGGLLSAALMIGGGVTVAEASGQQASHALHCNYPVKSDVECETSFNTNQNFNPDVEKEAVFFLGVAALAAGGFCAIGVFESYSKNKGQGNSSNSQQES